MCTGQQQTCNTMVSPETHVNVVGASQTSSIASFATCSVPSEAPRPKKSFDAMFNRGSSRPSTETCVASTTPVTVTRLFHTLAPSKAAGGTSGAGSHSSINSCFSFSERGVGARPPYPLHMSPHDTKSPPHNKNRQRTPEAVSMCAAGCNNGMVTITKHKVPTKAQRRQQQPGFALTLLPDCTAS